MSTANTSQPSTNCDELHRVAELMLDCFLQSAGHNKQFPIPEEEAYQVEIGTGYIPEAKPEGGGLVSKAEMVQRLVRRETARAFQSLHPLHRHKLTSAERKEHEAGFKRAQRAVKLFERMSLAQLEECQRDLCGGTGVCEYDILLEGTIQQRRKAKREEQLKTFDSRIRGWETSMLQEMFTEWKLADDQRQLLRAELSRRETSTTSKSTT